MSDRFAALCVFCGSSRGLDEAYAEAATRLGRELVARGIDLVWGGGHVGLMGIVADAVLDAGGRAVGVIPSFMIERELGHPRASELVVVDSMHRRKATMAERADGFLLLPGGFGSLEEFFEVVTWAQLQIHAKPIGILNTRGFYEPLLALVRHAAEQGFIRPSQLDLFVVADTPAELLDRLERHHPEIGDWTAKVDVNRA